MGVSVERLAFWRLRDGNTARLGAASSVKGLNEDESLLLAIDDFALRSLRDNSPAREPGYSSGRSAGKDGEIDLRGKADASRQE